MRRWILIGGEFVDGTFSFVLVSFGTDNLDFVVLDGRKLVAD